MCQASTKYLLIGSIIINIKIITLSSEKKTLCIFSHIYLNKTKQFQEKYIYYSQ